MCDDLNCAIEGMDRSLIADTPNLKRLQKNGTIFKNAYSNCPICLPSRQSMFSGILPHKSGCMNLWDDWQKVIPKKTTRVDDPKSNENHLLNAKYLPEILKENGYKTYGVGKLLHQGPMKAEMWDSYGEGPNYGPFLYDQDGKLSAHPNSHSLATTEAFKRYGAKFQGIDNHWLQDDRMRCVFEFDNGSMDEYYRPIDGIQVFYDNINRKPFHYNNEKDRDLLPDENYANWVIDRLNEKHDKPFFLGLGLMKPHTPMIVPPSFIEKYPLEDIQLPKKLENDLEDCAKALIDHRPYGFALYEAIMEKGIIEYKRWLQAYLASVSFIDHQVGKVLDALKDSPYSENTIIIFTSDNGYHMGEKDFLFKDSLWEEGSQIPLIISGVGKKNNSCQDPVSLIDLYPTLLEFCGINIGSNQLDGHSLKSIIMDDCASRPTNRSALSSVNGQSGMHHSLRSQQYRYTLCQNGEEELYDHNNDPLEWTNLANSQHYSDIKATLRKDLLKVLWN